MTDASSGAGEPEKATGVFKYLEDHDVDEGLV